MPVPILAIGAGMLGGAALEFVYARGHPSTKDVIVGGVLGGLPIGIGLGGAVRLGRKAKKLHKFGRHYQTGVMSYGSKVLGAAGQRPGRWPHLGLRPEMFAIGVGAGSNYVVGQLYDLTQQSRRDQHASRSGRSKSRTSTRGASTTKSGASSKSGRRKPSQRRRGPKGRRSRGNSRRPTPWCRRHNRRHFCKYTRKR